MNAKEARKLIRKPGVEVYVSVTYTKDDARYLQVTKRQALDLFNDLKPTTEVNVLQEDVLTLLVG